ITMVDHKLADLLGLRRIGRTTIEGIAGEERADLFEGPTFIFTNNSRYTPPRGAALPSNPNRRNRRLQGIVGVGCFRPFVVEMDPQTLMLTLHQPRDFHYVGTGEVLPLKVRRSTAVVEASIVVPERPAISGLFEIDTGCDGCICLGHGFVESNKLLE